MKLIDIGAYNGDSALHFISYPDIDSIDAYEPNGDFKPLWKAINKYYPNIKFFECAVGTYDGEIDYDKRPAEHSLGASTTQSRDDFGIGQIIRVQCLDILSIIPNELFCLKIDAEGAELDILERLIAERKSELVDRLYVEFHTEKIQAHPAREEIIRWHFGKRLQPWQ